ncbi:MAG: hypothetical protein HRU01_01915, partial [Myxococcales bacterium]|nr:hypothetical protein [Myxococcales bacterium]
PIHRISSINHTQAHVDADGRVRLVLAHDDPGVANWLDTGGHRDGLLTFRWFWPNSDPSPLTRVVKHGEVVGLMPNDAPNVTPETRREEIRSRREHLAWRFRT